MPKLLMFGSEIEIESEDDEAPREYVSEDNRPVRTPIDAVALESRFLDHCLSHGWITVERSDDLDRYYLTNEGKNELAHFGLTRLA